MKNIRVLLVDKNRFIWDFFFLFKEIPIIFITSVTIARQTFIKKKKKLFFSLFLKRVTYQLNEKL